MVFFDPDEAAVTPQHGKTLDLFIEVYKRCGENDLILIAGHSDRSGPGKHNHDLSQRRSSAVRAYLIQRGLPDRLIEVHDFGDTQPLDKGPESRNRRVEVSFGPGTVR